MTMDGRATRLHNINRKVQLTMPGRWQIILFGACSLMIMVSGRVLCDRRQAGRVQQSNVVPYQSRNYPIQQASQNYERSLTPASGELDLGSVSATSLHKQQQPSVYHSIIDATDAGQSALSPAVQTSTSTIGDLNTAAGHHHGHAHGKYYEYRAVPKKKTWKFGYKRGNHKHTISRHEHGKAGKHPHFKTKVKWHDSKSKGKGIHLWDYNHHDKKHYHHG